MAGGIVGKTVAVTGAAGYFGRVLTDHLLAQPWVDRVIGLDLHPLESHQRLLTYRIDTRETNLLRAVLAEHAVTDFIHAAFFTEPQPGMTDEQFRANNIEGSQYAIRTALEYGVEQFIFVSSVAVYGYHGGTPLNVSEQFRLAPNWRYGVQKVAVEAFLSEYGKHFPGTTRTVIRPVAICGQEGRTRSPLRALTRPGMFAVANRGRALTQAIHEDDCADLIVRAVERRLPGVYHAAPDDSMTWSAIGALTGLPVISVPRPMLDLVLHLKPLFPALGALNSEVISYMAESLTVDNAAAKKAFDWTPQHTSAEAFSDLFGRTPPLPKPPITTRIIVADRRVPPG